MTRLAVFLVAAAILALSGPLSAQTQDRIEAKLSTLSFAAIDRSQPLQVRLQDDSDDNKAVKAALEQALTQAGFRLAPDARFVMTFDATNSLTNNLSSRPTVFSVDGHKSSAGGDTVEARVKLFSTGEDSVLKRRPDEGPQGTAGSVRLDLGLMDRADGKRLWQGWAQVPAHSSDTQALTRALATPLVGHIGQAVRNKAVPVSLK
ncbi:MAG: hypothetical protein HQL45_12795 [Alphaproteobacteria bacterium]|nr:hypothetical protein [Alphaproteobacteria bacterium]